MIAGHFDRKETNTNKQNIRGIMETELNRQTKCCFRDAVRRSCNSKAYESAKIKKGDGTIIT